MTERTVPRGAPDTVASVSRQKTLTIAATLACALLAGTAPTALATRYASPAGTSGDPCTLAQPCNLATAIGGTTAGDTTVRLLGGDYPPLAATVTVGWSGTDIAGEPGTGRPVIHVASGTQLRIISSSRLADVDVVAAAGVGDAVFAADGATVVERVRLSGAAVGAMLVTGSTTLAKPAVVRDSLVVNSGTGRGIQLECNGCSDTARVLNATVLTTDGPALYAFAAGASGTQTTTLQAINTVASSKTANDVVATGGGDHATVTLDHSAYASSGANPSGLVTVVGGSVGDPPAFADAPGGDYTPAPGSSLIDAGIDPGTPALSATDLLGRPRILGGGVDIGAREAPAAPLAVTGDASAVTSTGATVAGTVNPGGLAAAWNVEYGTSTAYGATAGGAPATSAGAAAEAVGTTLAGLSPGTTYHYRVVAQHAYGTSLGADRTFTTPATPSGGGGTAPSGGPAATPDRTAPALAKLALTPKRVRRAKLRSPALTFTVSEAARVTVTLERLVPGRRSGARCVAARKAVAGTCVKPTRIATLTRAVPAGAAKLTISVRRGRTALPAGRYRVTVVARDAAGNAAAPQRVALTIAP